MANQGVVLQFSLLGEFDQAGFLDAVTAAGYPTDSACRVCAELTHTGLSEWLVSSQINVDLLSELARDCGLFVEQGCVAAQVTSDGTTVWVNAPDGCCIGRFGRRIIDIHKDGAAQLAEGTECLDCRKRTDDLDDDWRVFVDGMLAHHGVTVGVDHKPER